MISYRIGWERDEMYLFHMQTVLYLSISIAPFNLYQVSAAASQNLSASSQDLPCIRHCNLGLTNQTNNFLDVLISHHFLPAILQPTRVTTSSATLLDNIFTNVWPKMLSSSIIVTDISDHLPVIAWFTPQEPKKDGPVLF